MASKRRLHALLFALLVLAVMGCAGETGGDGEASGESAASEQPAQEQPAQEQPAQEQPSEGAVGSGESCPDVPVPGHEAVDVRAQGVACSAAAEVAAAAGGKGRQAYEAAGFACEPSDAPGGDTQYACTRGDARVTFRYGTA